jgi:hypothetical protein
MKEHNVTGTTPSPPSWITLLEIAVFIATTLMVMALVVGGILLVKSPVTIGTGYTALLIIASALVGVFASTRARAWVLRRRG